MSLLKAKVGHLPVSPGCYLMKNELGEVIYIGKAKNLKARVSSYFRSFDQHSPKTQSLVERIVDFDYILTSNEVESFVLENNLIKQHRPKFNIRLRDDKTYPYLQWRKDQRFPRLEYTRRPQIRQRAVEVIGPFPDGHAMGTLLYLLNRLFGLRDCTDLEFSRRKYPCLLYQMKQCSAPCMSSILNDDYDQRLKLVLDFFQKPNREGALVQLLTAQMMEAAEGELYEKAQEYKEVLQLMLKFFDARSHQVVENLKERRDLDLVQFVRGAEGEEEDFVIYILRQGVLLGQEHFYWTNPLDFTISDDLLAHHCSKLAEYYHSRPLPDALMGNWSSEEAMQLQEWLTQLLKRPVRVMSFSEKFRPLAAQVYAYGEQQQQWRRQERVLKGRAVAQLASLLHLDQLPWRLECYDVALWQGTSPTAAQIVFVDERPQKESYRHYHLSERPEKNNDPAMMLEVISRRLERGAPFPDVIILDGGKSQLSVIGDYLKHEHGNLKLPVVALAKEKNGLPERLYLQGAAHSLDLNAYGALKNLLVQMRDEAHRFSRRLHHHQEKKRFFNE